MRSAFSLKIWTVAAICPISSRRSTAGTSTSSSPAASLLMAALSDRTGLVMLRAMTRPTRAATQSPASANARAQCLLAAAVCSAAPRASS